MTPTQCATHATYAEAMPSREEKSRDEKRRVENRRDEHDASASNGVAPEEHDLQLLAEELTGQPYVLANLHSSFGAKAVRQLSVHGWERLAETWRDVAADAGGQPTLRQLVLGADDRLDPVPQAPRMTAAERKAAEKDAVLASIREEYARAKR